MPSKQQLLVTRRLLLTGSLAATTLALASCTSKTGEGVASASASASEPAIPRTLRLAASAPPVSLDPALANDNESFRITRQVYETLISIDANTGSPIAGLAEAWTQSEDGLRYTFTLRRGVRFHDGSEFNAAAVVANFNRWVKLPKDLQLRSSQGFMHVFHHEKDIPKLPTEAELKLKLDKDTTATEEQQAAETQRLAELEKLKAIYAQDLFTGKSLGGSASYFAGVEATEPYVLTLKLRRPRAGLIEALTLPGMAIAAPDSLTGGPKSNPSEALLTAPSGTGPYKFVSNDQGTVNLELFADYWDKTKLSNNPNHPEAVVVSPIPSPYNRESALMAEEIDGFDMVSVDIMRTLVRNAKVVVQRDPFSVLYLGLDHRNEWLAKPEFRMAITHAVNRGRLADNLFLQGSKSAQSILPPAFGVPEPEGTLNHSSEKAKQLLADIEYKGEIIEFAYPLRVSRNYLPLPERTFAQLAEDLAAVGIRIKPRPIAWTDGYVDTVRSTEFNGMHLLGFSGGYRLEDDFISGILDAKEHEFGYTSKLLDSQVLVARSLPPGEERTAAMTAILATLNTDLPLVPLVFPISALAFNPNVTYYPSSPMLNESYLDVQMTNSPALSS
ncbi:ABC transporter substrate-binding protein [Glutamicibacter sp. AOP12-B1-11]|uniref:ABC transporter substrate-binding protein n=1 Tax=Glutamicibacter sp. AOP12-B1-11 TaxID=3457725 RepID=UPI00403339BA